jgi:hypothetical protein
MIIQLKSNSYLFAGQRLPALSEFTRALGCIGGTYTFELSERIYHHIFSCLFNVKKEYHQYYSKEYTSFPAFLYWKYDLDKEIIEENNKILEQSPFVGITPLYSDGDTVLYQLFEMDEGRSLLKKINKIVSRFKA